MASVAFVTTEHDEARLGPAKLTQDAAPASVQAQRLCITEFVRNPSHHARIPVDLADPAVIPLFSIGNTPGDALCVWFQ
jgi:hypothetical protein